MTGGATGGMLGLSTTAIGGGGVLIRTSGGGVIGGGGTSGMSSAVAAAPPGAAAASSTSNGLQVLGRLLDDVVGEAGDDRVAEQPAGSDRDDDDRHRPVAAHLFALGVGH